MVAGPGFRIQGLHSHKLTRKRNVDVLLKGASASFADGAVDGQNPARAATYILYYNLPSYTIIYHNTPYSTLLDIGVGVWWVGSRL